MTDYIMRWLAYQEWLNGPLQRHVLERRPMNYIIRWLHNHNDRCNGGELRR